MAWEAAGDGLGQWWPWGGDLGRPKARRVTWAAVGILLGVGGRRRRERGGGDGWRGRRRWNWEAEGEAPMWCDIREREVIRQERPGGKPTG